jgi:UDP-N-acetylmuramyl pentapeptide phosphotransferase/UDP-N-acetylglucosamine-1-phosphate transferase
LPRVKCLKGVFYIVLFAIPHLALTTAGLTSFVICLAIVWTQHLHGAHTLDSEAGVQKIHETPTPRIGGVAILIGLAIGWLFTPKEVAVMLGPILIASLPAFLLGWLKISLNAAASPKDYWPRLPAGYSLGG